MTAQAIIRSTMAFALLGLAACTATESLQPRLEETPLHLEEYLSEASVTGSVIPERIPEPVVWDFAGSLGGWKSTPPRPHPRSIRPARFEKSEEGVILSLDSRNRNPTDYPVGGAHVEVGDWNPADYPEVVLRARSTGPARISLAANLMRDDPDEWPWPYEARAQSTSIVGDGTVQTYRLRAEWRFPEGLEPVIRQLGLWAGTEDSVEIEILSISAVPAEATYADTSPGTRQVARSARYRRVLYAHAPSRLAWSVRVPAGGRLDTGLGAVRAEPPVTFRVRVEQADSAVTVLEETVADLDAWAQRSVDLSKWAGRTVTLALETASEYEGAIGLWAAPTLAGSERDGRPNVVFYVIDGGAADQMSAYGYWRNTTPFLEELAAEGARFEWAYSNSSWSKPSTTSFMTSLQSSVLGNTGERFDPLPEQALTMAQRFHAAGYQTAVFTTNPWAATASSLERGTDRLRDQYFEPNSASSRELHRNFWRWREEYPGRPFWAHFQTTDVHGPTTPIPPFAGLYLSPGRRDAADAWGDSVGAWLRENRPEGGWLTSEVWEETGIDRVAAFTAERDRYDETVAHQDAQLRRFVRRLEDTGDWENTLLVIGADHSTRAATGFDFGQLLQDSLPPSWGPIFRSYVSRVPLIFVWPGHVEPGRTFRRPVSMIDVLPTVLDLVGLPQPEIRQGRSLAPLLRGEVDEAAFETRPVIFDEFRRDEASGELQGRVEVVDGRWGASMWVGPPSDSPRDAYPAPVLLYDLWEDPLALHSVHEKRPDLVARYTEFLEAQWEAHQALATRFRSEGEIELTAEQIETLRSLGYIQ